MVTRQRRQPDPSRRNGPPKHRSETAGHSETRKVAVVATPLVAVGASVVVLFVAVAATFAATAREPHDPPPTGAPTSSAAAASVEPVVAVRTVPKPKPGEARYGIDVSWPQCGASLP